MTDIISLYQFPSCWGLPNASPFCMKVETFLRMNNINYETVETTMPMKSPTKKLPIIMDNNQCIYDSSLIIDYLKNKFNLTLDDSLSAKQQALSIALQRLCEEHLYWAIVYSRWIVRNGWQHTKKAYFESLPKLLKLIIPSIVRAGVKKALHSQGLSRLSVDELYKRGIADLTVLKTQLEEHDFLLDSTQTTSIDATGYAFVENIRKDPISSPLKDYVNAHGCFERYCQKIKSLYFQDASGE